MSAKSINASANEYRRNFNWRVTNGRPIRSAEAAGMAYLATSDYPDILEDLLFVSRKRQRNRTALAKLQLQILAELRNQEQAIKHYKAKLGEGSEYQQQCEAEIFRYRMIGNALRIIGDGIAWRALRYDRIIPRVFSEHPVKHVVTEAGTSVEIEEFLAINRGLSIPILNAITNCLAIGDITAIDPDDNVEVVEVKTSNTSDRRKTRQKIKLKEKVRLLDERGGPSHGREVFLDRLPIKPNSHLPALESLLERCGVEGWSSGVIGSHIYVEMY